MHVAGLVFDDAFESDEDELDPSATQPIHTCERTTSVKTTPAIMDDLGWRCLPPLAAAAAACRLLLAA
jgi:hypothetical protein